MRQFLRSLFVFLVFGSLIGSCSTALKPYERQYINDPEMSMAGSRAVKFQHYICAIREGAIVAEGNKGSGGCGCN
ncbi:MULTISPECIES: DUF4266 domain-containing protein [Flavobacteriaceae]|uniref:DUF4266 domain-containing protein n=1 Tax=Flavobacteriaceae TaxID=49546 RepID=UPI00149248B7|nr:MULTISPECIES: DUF4266 domain-containing protein [Allomuricauda]MDC6364908.1 DUF4266 domain-containing protein [Muricauda sp. AC10]